MGRATPTQQAEPAHQQQAIPLSSLLEMLMASSGEQKPDPHWVQNLKRLVDPNVDPRGELIPRNPNVDPGLNRPGPRVGDVLGV
jgi:hypothetical protein